MIPTHVRYKERSVHSIYTVLAFSLQFNTAIVNCIRLYNPQLPLCGVRMYVCANVSVHACVSVCRVLCDIGLFVSASVSGCVCLCRCVYIRVCECICFLLAARGTRYSVIRATLITRGGNDSLSSKSPI